MNNQKITPCLWVEKDANAVAEYYLSIFKDGKLKDYRKFENPPNDFSSDSSSFETAVIEIAGMEFSILAAGPLFKFNEAVSFVSELQGPSRSRLPLGSTYFKWRRRRGLWMVQR